ncbi:MULTISPECIES: efflux RND transporter periplasmic adaptor subunit [Halanaerobium]|uniref:RND family efflux transporter, MFP subunit n=1 Tax=Halanaerobium kushneri TaxID=56779 RepID=A0A1N6WZL6_9FIRM|nr:MULTISPECIES: efflux RND transporter periplasmic adaptor subunit [Halanaerobium]RCW50800.1 RND family efflux transporter MFP subunit [Halanaerobium sp. ST460_2HS_T2]SIQ95508.1 RND family efflux transporter, MFP subunit [Halanaerobium kushneri]
MKNRYKILSLLLILFLTASPVLAQEAQIVETAQSVTDDISLNELFTGTLTPIQDVNIPAQTGGLIAQVNVEMGNQVDEDAQLIKIDEEALLIQKNRAEAALNSAQASYEELKNGTTEEELARTRAAYEDAQASLESAETNLELMQELYKERRTLEQQLVNAEQQLNNARQQLQTSKQNLNQAEVNFNQAKREYERSQKLYDDNVISEREYENAKTSFENAESTYKNAQISVEQAETALAAAEKNYKLTKATYNNPTELKQQLENAKSQVNSARTNLKVSKANLEAAERGPREERVRAGLASVKQAKASLAEIEDQIDKTKVNAPFSGLVNRVNVEAGEMIPAGQTVVNLINIDQLFAEINVTAATVSAIKKGDTVDVRGETMQHYIEGEITNIAPAADEASRTFLVKIKIPNQDHRLRAGMFADVRITKGKSGSAVVIPIESVVNLNSDNPHVFVVEDGKSVRRDISIGISTDSRVEVLQGLKANQEVIIRGQNNLEAGQKVEVRNQ